MSHLQDTTQEEVLWQSVLAVAEPVVLSFQFNSGSKPTYHLASGPRLLRRFLMIGTRKVTAIVVLDRSFGSLTTANWIFLNGKRRSAFGLKPPIPASRSMARNATRIVGAQGTALARSYTVFATVMTSSAVASIFSTVNSVQSPSSIAPAPKIHYTSKG
jgi:hypothetical protein